MPPRSIQRERTEVGYSPLFSSSFVSIYHCGISCFQLIYQFLFGNLKSVARSDEVKVKVHFCYQNKVNYSSQCFLSLDWNVGLERFLSAAGSWHGWLANVQ